MLRRLRIRRWLSVTLLSLGPTLLPAIGAFADDAAQPQPLPAAAQEQAGQKCGPDGCRNGESSGRAGLAGAAGCRGGVAGCRDWGYGQHDLFYNYYMPPTCGGIGAYLYTSPGPIPQHVGHTYITYQPLMPHEFLYPHHRTYHRSYDEGRGISRTHVMYYNPPVRQALGGVGNMFKIAR